MCLLTTVIFLCASLVVASPFHDAIPVRRYTLRLPKYYLLLTFDYQQHFKDGFVILSPDEVSVKS